jgi:hypothetical protein
MTNLALTEWIVILLILAANLFWLFTLVRVASDETGTNRVVWIVVVALTHVFGAVAYFLVGRKSAIVRRYLNGSIRN